MITNAEYNEYEWDEYPEPLWDETAAEVRVIVQEWFAEVDKVEL